MAETKFTPGPWTLANENNEFLEVQLGGEHFISANFGRHDTMTGKLVISREEMIANGHLAMAAPDLYSVMQKFVDLWDSSEWPYGTKEIVEEARVLLAKARGEVVAND